MVIDAFMNLDQSDQRQVAKQLGLDSSFEESPEEEGDGVEDFVPVRDRAFDDAVPDKILIGHDVMEIEDGVMDPTVCWKMVEGFPSHWPKGDLDVPVRQYLKTVHLPLLLFRYCSDICSAPYTMTGQLSLPC